MRYFYCFLCCFCLGICETLKAQENFDSRAIETGFFIGKVVKNYPVFPDRNISNVYNVSYYKKLSGNKSWHRNYHFPEVTLQGWFGHLGNQQILGRFYGLTGGLRYIQQLGKRWSISEQVQFGIAYFTVQFNEQTNPENIAIGSSVTPFPNFRLSVNYNFNSNFFIAANAGIVHASNGHYKLPNLGINLPFIGVSFCYKNSLERSRIDTKEDVLLNKKIHVATRTSLGLNEQGTSTNPVNGPKYPIYLTSLFIHKNYTPVARWQLGFESYYNTGVYDFIISQDYYQTKQHKKSVAALVIVGNEFLFGHVSVVTQGGVYLYNPFYKDRYKQTYNEGDTKAWLKTKVTARLGFQYYLRDAVLHPRNNFFVGWYVKTNFGQADFMECSLGYSF